MDLKIKDVAELLNVSEATIHEWLKNGLIPAYQHRGQPRFSKLEIESWVMNHRLRNANGTSPFNEKDEPSPEKAPKLTGGSQKFSLYRALHKGLVLKNIQAGNKEELIRHSSKCLSEHLKLDNEILAELLIDRENLQSTALNNGIAVPHARDFILSPMHDMITIAFPDKPIPYDALDGQPVHTLIFLFACNDKRHLHLLAKIAHLSNQQKTLDLLQTQPSKEELLEFVHNWESHIPHPEDD